PPTCLDLAALPAIVRPPRRTVFSRQGPALPERGLARVFLGISREALRMKSKSITVGLGLALAGLVGGWTGLGRAQQSPCGGMPGQPMQMQPMQVQPMPVQEMPVQTLPAPGQMPMNSGAPHDQLSEMGLGQTPDNPTGRQEPAVSIEWIGPSAAKIGQPIAYQ